MHPFLNKIGNYIKRHELFSKRKTYLVALSGGADSVCLLRVMLTLGYQVEAVHCNFHLRGEESDRDEEFCRTLADKLEVKLHIVGFDTHSYAKERKISTEMAARELRYRFFEQLLTERGLASVVVAHHRNDAIETLLLNLIRGTGIDGMKGIRAKNGCILRPLLAVSREEIEAYLDELGQDYVLDSSNSVDDVKRNVVRLRLMPILKSLNPRVEENLMKTISQVTDSLDFLYAAIEEAKKRVSHKRDRGITIDIPALLREVSPETILWEILKDEGFSSSEVMQIFNHLDAQTGKMWHSPTHMLLIDRENLIVVPIDEEAKKIGPLFITTCDVDDHFEIIREKNRVSLDAAKVKMPISMRFVKRGDWFVPYGMEGRKSLAKYLTEKKVPVTKKEYTFVVTDIEDNILWVVGHRADNRFCITEDTTQALILEVPLDII